MAGRSSSWWRHSDRALVAELTRSLRPGMRLDPVRIRFNRPNQEPVALTASGYQLAEIGGGYYFTLRLGTALSADGRSFTVRRDANRTVGQGIVCRGRQAQSARPRSGAIRFRSPWCGSAI